MRNHSVSIKNQWHTPYKRAGIEHYLNSREYKIVTVFRKKSRCTRLMLMKLPGTPVHQSEVTGLHACKYVFPDVSRHMCVCVTSVETKCYGMALVLIGYITRSRDWIVSHMHQSNGRVDICGMIDHLSSYGGGGSLNIVSWTSSKPTNMTMT